MRMVVHRRSGRWGPSAVSCAVRSRIIWTACCDEVARQLDRLDRAHRSGLECEPDQQHRRCSTRPRSVYHAPVSTTHTITSAIMGVGATKPPVRGPLGRREEHRLRVGAHHPDVRPRRRPPHVPHPQPVHPLTSVPADGRTGRTGRAGRAGHRDGGRCRSTPTTRGPLPVSVTCATSTSAGQQERVLDRHLVRDGPPRVLADDVEHGRQDRPVRAQRPVPWCNSSRCRDLCGDAGRRLVVLRLREHPREFRTGPRRPPRRTAGRSCCRSAPTGSDHVCAPRRRPAPGPARGPAAARRARAAGPARPPATPARVTARPCRATTTTRRVQPTRAVLLDEGGERRRGRPAA